MDPMGTDMRSTFVPTRGVKTTSAGTMIPLAKARYILRGQYFDPISKSDQPLPPHRFLLVNVAPKTLEPVIGDASDRTGLSWIPFDDDGRVDTPDGVWALAWQPLLLGPDGTRAPASDWARMLGVFIDLEKREWVHPNDVARIDRRKLVRFLVWVSISKATRGGFGHVPPKTRFAESGVLRFNDGELRGFGEPSKPWVIQVDHGLFRNYLRFHYYDATPRRGSRFRQGSSLQPWVSRA